MWQELLAQTKKTGPLFGMIGAAAGFVSDILQPLAPLSGYVFFATAFASVTILVAMLVRSSLRTTVVPAFIFSLGMMVCSGGLYTIQGEEDVDTGVMAGAFPVIKSLQSSLGLIAEDIAAIKKSTEKIEKSTARTEKTVKQIEKNTKETTEATKKVADAVQDSTKKIVGSLEEIQKGFTALTQSGGIIANPTRPEQFYHNARVYEQGGDYGNARKSYNQYFSFKLNLLDPHLRYQTFLKIQEGRAGAREIYSAIFENDPRPVIEFARILLFDAPTRTEMLKKFITKNPDFSPAYYELSKEFSESRIGTQSLSDKKEELSALEKFNSLRESGKFLKYFVDNELASKWISDSDKRFKALSLITEMKDKSPLSITAAKSNQGWTVTVHISEVAREIFYTLPNMKEFKSLGHLDFINSNTGLPLPKTFFNLTCPPAKKKYRLRCDLVNTIIEFKYIDINKNVRGPFTIKFNGKSQIDKFCRNMINVSYGGDVKRILTYPGCEYFLEEFHPQILKKLKEDKIKKEKRMSEIRAEKQRKKIQQERQNILNFVQPKLDRFNSGDISKAELCEHFNQFVEKVETNVWLAKSIAKNFKNGVLCKLCPYGLLCFP